MKQRKMNLAAFVVAGPVSGHHGGWRYPTADRNLLSLDYYRNVGRILENGRFDLIFFADILAIPNRYEGRLDSQLRTVLHVLAEEGGRAAHRKDGADAEGIGGVGAQASPSGGCSSE